MLSRGGYVAWMSLITTIVILVFLLGGFLSASGSEEFGRPVWGTEDKWRYRSWEVVGRNSIVADYDVRVVKATTLAGEPVYAVEDTGHLRTHPAVALGQRPGQPIERSRRIWTLYSQDLAPRVWLDTNCLPVRPTTECPWLSEEGNWTAFTKLATLEGWKAFDWPLAAGKKWSGRATVKYNTELIDEYRAETTGVEEVLVRGGTFRTAVVVHRGSIREGDRRVDYTMRRWFAPAVKNVVRMELTVGRDTLAVELSR